VTPSHLIPPGSLEVRVTYRHLPGVHPDMLARHHRLSIIQPMTPE